MTWSSIREKDFERERIVVPATPGGCESQAAHDEMVEAVFIWERNPVAGTTIRFLSLDVYIHVLLIIDAIRRPLQPSYEGPY